MTIQYDDILYSINDIYYDILWYSLFYSELNEIFWICVCSVYYSHIFILCILMCQSDIKYIKCNVMILSLCLSNHYCVMIVMIYSYYDDMIYSDIDDIDDISMMIYSLFYILWYDVDDDCDWYLLKWYVFWWWPFWYYIDILLWCHWWWHSCWYSDVIFCWFIILVPCYDIPFCILSMLFIDDDDVIYDTFWCTIRYWWYMISNYISYDMILWWSDTVMILIFWWYYDILMMYLLLMMMIPVWWYVFMLWSDILLLSVDDDWWWRDIVFWWYIVVMIPLLLCHACILLLFLSRYILMMMYCIYSILMSLFIGMLYVLQWYILLLMIFPVTDISISVELFWYVMMTDVDDDEYLFVMIFYCVLLMIHYAWQWYILFWYSV